MNRGIIIFLLCLSTNISFGQKNITNQNLIWYGLFTTININEKWYFQNEIQERHYVNPTSQHQFLLRNHLHRRFGKSGWETSLGMCFFLQNPNDPKAANKLTVPELRPHIEFAYKQRLNKLIIDHGYRAEARFFHNTNTPRTELEEGFDFGNFRFRYKIQATMTLFESPKKKFFRLIISNEVHINAGNKILINTFDQNRIYGGISYNILQNLTCNIGYLNWFQQRPRGDFFNRNILRFAVYHTLKLK